MARSLVPVAYHVSMRARDSGLFRAGIALLVIGCGPLVGFLIVQNIGLISDPNPNPIGLGLLAFFTLPISILLIALGVGRARSVRDRR
jgi:hypothetical protein